MTSGFFNKTEWDLPHTLSHTRPLSFNETDKPILFVSVLHDFSKTVMLKPVTLPCGHSGCLSCYGRLLEVEEQRGKSKANCPECRTGAFGRESLKAINFAMNKITSNLPVKCLQNECNWRGVFEEAEDHNRQCPGRAKISCPLGCCEKLLW